MINLAYGMVAVWFLMLVFFAARGLNLMRLVLNNLAPGANYWGSANDRHFSPLGAKFRIEGTSIDPALLTDAGRAHQKRAIRNNWMMLAWAVIGFVLIGCFLSYIDASAAAG